MGTTITVIIIILVIVVILALIGMSSYNGFVKSRNLIQESWRQIDVELNRRYELIPNLVETVRAYAAHERNTLEDVTRLRSQAQQLSQSEGALPSQQRADVEAALSGAVRNLIVSVEAYPDLKSNQNFLELQQQLAETEDRIAAGRRFYNANVRVYNTKIESVPTNIIAGMFNFEKAAYFQVDEPAVRQAPDVNFGEIAYRGEQDQRQLPPQQSAPPVQFDDRQSDSLPNPQEYQQPQQGYQPPQQGSYQAPQQGGAYQSPQQGGGSYQSPQQGGGSYQSPQQGGYVPPETGPQNPNQR
jgi:LemA protein